MRKLPLRRDGLFWRLFRAFAVAMLAIVVVFTGIMTIYLRNARQDSYEEEVLNQAREVAGYMSFMNRLSYFSQDSTMRWFMIEKMDFIQTNYQADIWLVSYESGIVQCLDSNLNTSEVTLSGPAFELLQKIRDGEETRAQGIFRELGDDIVTIGVPWMYRNTVVGAVLLHISVKSLEVRYGTLLLSLIPMAVLALLAGVVVCWFLAAGQTKPIREISGAMRDFGRGDAARRVNLTCGGEMQELGEAFNRMADELERQEETRKSFVANVSHELRSPLTSVRGYVQAMLDGTIGGEDAPKYLRVVMDETVRLSDLVKDLLDLSRIESGKMPMSMSDFDITETVRRVLVNYAQRIDRKGIRVEVDLPEEPCRVRGDANRISQVVSNIVDNAVKFLPEEDGALSLAVRPGGETVRVSVTDNGPGISQEDLPHIFERFYKADKAHTAGMGTGLGLAICQKIMEQHNSRIEVESRPGNTTFFFDLPAAQDDTNS